MTTMSRLTPSRRALLGLAAAAALLVACEARRPAPVAPVTDFAVKDGKTFALTFDEREADSLKVTLSGVVDAAPFVVRTDDVTKPLLMVYNATGAVVFTGRVDGSADAMLRGVSPDGIATVDVVKRSDLLPPEAKGGMIRVTLKPGATWPGAAADSAAGVRYRAPAPGPGGSDSARTGARVMMRRAPGDTSEAPGGTLRLRSAGGPPPTVTLEDADGKVLYEGPMGPKGQMGPFDVDPAGIATVNVHKSPATGDNRVVVRLKPGVTPARVR